MVTALEFINGTINKQKFFIQLLNNGTRFVPDYGTIEVKLLSNKDIDVSDIFISNELVFSADIGLRKFSSYTYETQFVVLKKVTGLTFHELLIDVLMLIAKYGYEPDSETDVFFRTNYLLKHLTNNSYRFNDMSFMPFFSFLAPLLSYYCSSDIISVINDIYNSKYTIYKIDHAATICKCHLHNDLYDTWDRFRIYYDLLRGICSIYLHKNEHVKDFNFNGYDWDKAFKNHFQKKFVTYNFITSPQFVKTIGFDMEKCYDKLKISYRFDAKNLYGLYID